MPRFLLGQVASAFKEQSREKRLFILLAFAVAFLISCDYAIIRPAANSLFISSFGSGVLPYAWIVAIPFNFILVALYNHYLPKVGSYKLMMATIALVMMGNAVFCLLLKSHPSLSFVFYIWKEVYLLLLFQQLWSEIHHRFHRQEVNFFYGAMYGMGALGALSGSLLPSFMSLIGSTENLLLLTLPIYFMIGVTFHLLMQHQAKTVDIEEEAMKPDPLAGLKLLFRSKPLIAIASVITLMQMASTFADFQLNWFLEKTIDLKDVRTEVNARILSVMHIFTIVFQFVGTYLIVAWLGVKKGHVAIPLLLLINGLAFLIHPTLITASMGYIAIKTLDFSLFSSLKEMLYAPLSRDEKYRAKSFIDVFLYRGSKSLASLLILLFQALFSAYLIPALSFTNIVLFLIWIALALKLIQEEKKAALV